MGERQVCRYPLIPNFLIKGDSYFGRITFFCSMKSHPIRVAINGFGRIGRCFLRRAIDAYSEDLQVIAINDPGSTEAMAHLLEFDSVQGHWPREIHHSDKGLVIDGHSISVEHQTDPAHITWGNQTPDVVLEATGRFKDRIRASVHLERAGRCVLSAVSSDEEVKTVVMGANQEIIRRDDRLVSNASCTTNSAAPLVDVVDRHLGVESGYITTVHSYTGDQTLHDSMHSDLRRARAAALSIIPTTTGAAKAITKIFPHLDGVIGGAGIRVPVPNASLTDITYVVKRPTSVEEVNQLFREAAKGKWKNYLAYTEKPLVSSDIIGNNHSCVFDSLLTSVIGKMVKVVGWYDNEMGYASRLCDLIVYWNGSEA
jgi:glyceraldehyde 3-phosphate dehydrogenase